MELPKTYKEASDAFKQGVGKEVCDAMYNLMNGKEPMRLAYIIGEGEMPKDVVRIEFPIISNAEAATLYGDPVRRQVRITTEDNGDFVLLINPTIISMGEK